MVDGLDYFFVNSDLRCDHVVFFARGFTLTLILRDSVDTDCKL